jgi:hypothetical protein
MPARICERVSCTANQKKSQPKSLQVRSEIVTSPFLSLFIAQKCEEDEREDGNKMLEY